MESTARKFSLGDDGTMDTVIICDDCGEELRYNYSGETGETYDEFLEWAFEDAESEHECEDGE